MYQSNTAYKRVELSPVILFEQTCQIQGLVEISSSSGPTLISCPAFNPFPAHQCHPSIVKSPGKAQSSLTILCKGTASSEMPSSSFSVAISLMTPPQQVTSGAHSDLLMSSSLCQSSSQNCKIFCALEMELLGRVDGTPDGFPVCSGDQSQAEAAQALCTPTS